MKLLDVIHELNFEDMNKPLSIRVGKRESRDFSFTVQSDQILIEEVKTNPDEAAPIFYKDSLSAHCFICSSCKAMFYYYKYGDVDNAGFGDKSDKTIRINYSYCPHCGAKFQPKAYITMQEAQERYSKLFNPQFDEPIVRFSYKYVKDGKMHEEMFKIPPNKYFKSGVYKASNVERLRFAGEVYHGTKVKGKNGDTTKEEWVENGEPDTEA